MLTKCYDDYDKNMFLEILSFGTFLGLQTLQSSRIGILALPVLHSFHDVASASHEVVDFG